MKPTRVFTLAAVTSFFPSFNSAQSIVSSSYDAMTRSMAAPSPSATYDASKDPKYDDLRKFYQDQMCLFWDPPDHGPQPKEQCKNICGDDAKKKYEQQVIQASWTCIAFNKGMTTAPWESARGDHDPNSAIKVTPGKCYCDLEIIKEIGEFMVKSVDIIARIACSAWVGAISIVIEFGSMAIPGVGQAVNAAMKVAIQAAKAFEYMYDASDAAAAFADWSVSGLADAFSQKVCGTSAIFTSSDLMNVFHNLTQVPDSVVPRAPTNPGTPRNCKKGRPCGDGPSNNDPKISGPQAPTQNPDPSRPATTKHDLSESATTPRPTSSQSLTSSHLESSTSTTSSGNTTSFADERTSSGLTSSTASSNSTMTYMSRNFTATLGYPRTTLSNRNSSITRFPSLLTHMADSTLTTSLRYPDRTSKVEDGNVKPTTQR